MLVTAISCILMSLFSMLLMVWMFYSPVYKSRHPCSLLGKMLGKILPWDKRNFLQDLTPACISCDAPPQALKSSLIKLSLIPECAVSFTTLWLCPGSQWFLRLQIWSYNDSIDCCLQAFLDLCPPHPSHLRLHLSLLFMSKPPTPHHLYT